jgi:hypothetical protein
MLYCQLGTRIVKNTREYKEPQMNTTIEYVEVKATKSEIECNLLGTGIRVTASQMTEEGWGLVLEGDGCEVSNIISMWQRVGYLIESKELACRGMGILSSE